MEIERSYLKSEKIKAKNKVILSNFTPEKLRIQKILTAISSTKIENIDKDTEIKITKEKVLTLNQKFERLFENRSELKDKIVKLEQNLNEKGESEGDEDKNKDHEKLKQEIMNLQKESKIIEAQKEDIK